MARVAGFCYDCRSKVRDPLVHRSTAKHRAATIRTEGEIMVPRPAWTTRRESNGTDAENVAASARLLGLDIIREDDPDAEDGYYSELYDPMRRMVRTAPCPRCGREDWRSKRGREYHVTTNLECVRWRKPERHVYAMIGG